MEAKKAMEDLRLEMDTERSELKRRLTQGESEAGQAGAQWKAQMEALTEEIEAAKSTLALEKVTCGQHSVGIFRCSMTVLLARLSP